MEKKEATWGFVLELYKWRQKNETKSSLSAFFINQLEAAKQNIFLRF